MALSGLDIYKLLPKTNCKDCGYSTCLAFAMALAQKKASLDKCPHVTAAAREALESASRPPIRLVTVGTASGRIESGNETVMYRHEQKFHHPSAVGFMIEDTLSGADIDKKLAAINELKFERVGQNIGAALICVGNVSGRADKLASAVGRVFSKTDLPMAVSSGNAAAAAAAVAAIASKKPLLICRNSAELEGFVRIAKEHNIALAITCRDTEEAARLTESAKNGGVEDIMLDFETENVSKKIQLHTYSRRMALKKNFKALGYPVIAFTHSDDPSEELSEAIGYISKYAGIVIMKNTARDFVYPLLVTRQDIYQDPQKPVQVEPKIYEIGKVNANSPLLITTNFSITYFTVAGEVENSKVPSYIMCCDCEGMSVLTAWAADKFTAESIAEAVKKASIDKIVSHRKIIIPGYVSVLSGRLEEASGYKVCVGPREASGITAYLRGWKHSG